MITSNLEQNVEGTDSEHTCGPECAELAARMRKEVAENLLATTPEHRREEILMASRAAAEMAKAALPTLDDDARALALEFCAAVLAKVMSTPVAALSEIIDTTMVGYSIGAAIIAAGYELPDEIKELPAPGTPDEELPSIDLRQTGQYL